MTSNERMTQIAILKENLINKDIINHENLDNSYQNKYRRIIL